MKKRPIVEPIIVLVLGVIAGIWYALSDFGGYYWETGGYYSRTRTWENLNFFHPISGPFMWITMLLLVALIVIMIIALASKKFGSRKAPYITGLVLISAVFIISVLGAIAVEIVGQTGDYNDWWHNDSCFVGNIAPILIIPVLIIGLIRVSRARRNGFDSEE